MIDMYVKCGNFIYVRRIFDNMFERIVILWNVMFVGYSKYGMGLYVVEFFKLMRLEGKVKFDSVIFLVVLFGCSYGGIENIGLKIFYEMLMNGVELNIEYYGCIVDLFGRFGKLQKVLIFIKEMFFKLIVVIWGCFLGVCRVYFNFDVGEYVGR